MRARLALLSAAVLAAAQPVLAASSFSSDASDMWWNPGESGWGANVVQQGNVVFITLYVYAADGKAHWFVAPDNEASGPSAPIVFSGQLYETTGPVFSASFNPNQVGTRQVGMLSFQYSPPNSASLVYSVDGTVVTKALQRQTWRAPAFDQEYEGMRSLRSSCQSGGSYGEGVDFIVTQSGSSLTLEMHQGLPAVCFYSGTLQPAGHLSSLSGTASCQWGDTPFAFSDIEVSVHGFTAHYDATERGCHVFGNVAATNRTNNPQ
jgi:hypothetical protein